MDDIQTQISVMVEDFTEGMIYHRFYDVGDAVEDIPQWLEINELFNIFEVPEIAKPYFIET